MICSFFKHIYLYKKHIIFRVPYATKLSNLYIYVSFNITCIAPCYIISTPIHLCKLQYYMHRRLCYIISTPIHLCKLHVICIVPYATVCADLYIDINYIYCPLFYSRFTPKYLCMLHSIYI